MKKVILILLTFCLVSMFFFPFEFHALPGYNVKKLMAAVGIFLCGFYFLRKKQLSVPSNLFSIVSLAGVISLIALFSMSYNGTIDDAYSGYIASMAVWLSAAFVVCSSIKLTHGEVTIELLSQYIIAVCVMQCVSALVIDNNVAVRNAFDSLINIDQPTLKEANRLYGFGANLDVAGAKFSVCLILITSFLHKHKIDLNVGQMFLYIVSFIIITVIGSMIARTTYVGVVLSVLYMAFCLMSGGINFSEASFKLLGLILMIIFLAVVVCVYQYNHDPNFRYWLRFAFEGFFNLFESGEYSVASNNTLKEMYVFPNNIKTWIIGDGYFSNPYWSDPNFLWQGQNKRGFYMGTDVGYLRFIFYFGIIGMLTFVIYMYNAFRVCAKKMKDYKMLFFFVLLVNYVVWLKVATDLFLAFALFICVVNMQDGSLCDSDGVE